MFLFRPIALPIIALATVLAACSPRVDTRGALPEQDVVAEIVPGVHRREDVAAILGTPSTVGTFDARKWYYIGRQVEQFAFFKPDVQDQRVLIVSFDADGLVDGIDRRGLEDARQISMSDRETPTAGHELTFFEQLFGNVGRFTKGEGNQSSE